MPRQLLKHAAAKPCAVAAWRLPAVMLVQLVLLLALVPTPVLLLADAAF
jgi:hypothetical protein